MKITITGSLGNIGKPLTKTLIENGHSVTVISSDAKRKEQIESLGATAAIGSINDIEFLTETFSGADIVYLMEVVASELMFTPGFDIIEAYSEIAQSYKQAIEKAGVKKVIHLSSIGAHTTEGNGLLCMHYYAEKILNSLSDDVGVKFMRPVGFYTNLYRSIPGIKANSAIVFNYGGGQKEPWVSPKDIASAIAEEMESPFMGRTIRYIASEEISPNEIAVILGNAIGNPDLKWNSITDEQMIARMVSIGMNEQIAKGFTEMQAAQGSGVLYEDYYKNKPVLGKTKFVDFAKEFAEAFKQ